MGSDEPPFNSAPDVAGTGPLTCSCGALHTGPAAGHHALTLTMRCTACGDTMEVWSADEPRLRCDCGHDSTEHHQHVDADEITYPCQHAGCRCADMGDLHDA